MLTPLNSDLPPHYKWYLPCPLTNRSILYIKFQKVDTSEQSCALREGFRNRVCAVQGRLR